VHAIVNYGTSTVPSTIPVINIKYKNAFNRETWRLICTYQTIKMEMIQEKEEENRIQITRRERHEKICLKVSLHI
jgi:hypothetical protein